MKLPLLIVCPFVAEKPAISVGTNFTKKQDLRGHELRSHCPVLGAWTIHIAVRFILHFFGVVLDRRATRRARCAAHAAPRRVYSESCSTSQFRGGS